MDDPDLKNLIAQAQDGNSRAFETLVNGHYTIMFKMAFKWCGNKEMAEEITQESCIKLARFIGKYKGESAFTSWLYRLVINTGKDWAKAQKRHKGTDTEIDFIIKPDQKEERAYTRQVVEAIYALPKGECEALILVLKDGYTHAQAADILQVSEGTISWRVSEARKKLAAQFQEDQKYG